MNHGARFLVSPVLDMLFTGMISAFPSAENFHIDR